MTLSDKKSLLNHTIKAIFARKLQTTFECPDKRGKSNIIDNNNR